jgi:hypothetical protein
MHSDILHMTKWKSNVQEYKHVDLVKNDFVTNNFQGRASTCGAWGENSIKITTSIMVKFSLVTDLWVA